ncbi:hypothetical protein KM043_014585 [Ampulex compressa]|nr:hypothetical protein KM043_014585 [Ampulex compressa]
MHAETETGGPRVLHCDHRANWPIEIVSRGAEARPELGRRRPARLQDARRRYRRGPDPAHAPEARGLEGRAEEAESRLRPEAGRSAEGERGGGESSAEEHLRERLREQVREEGLREGARARASAKASFPSHRPAEDPSSSRSASRRRARRGSYLRLALLLLLGAFGQSGLLESRVINLSGKPTATGLSVLAIGTVIGAVSAAPLDLIGDAGVRAERSANLSHITGASRKIQMYIKNRHLQILPDGSVNGSNDHTSDYSEYAFPSLL